MKKYIAGLLLLACCWSCAEDDLFMNSNKISYIFFTNDVQKDTTVTSFVFYRSDVIEVPLAVSSAGRLVDEDIPLKLRVNKELTTLPESYYALPDDAVFRSGRTQDTVFVTFYNNAVLKDTEYCLTVELVPNGFEPGALNFRRAKIYISDKMIQPEWWLAKDMWGDQNVATTFYLGKYSEKKYGLLLDILDGVELDGNDRAQLRTYALKLKYYVQEWNDDHYPDRMMDEENNEYMTIPVAG